MATVERRRDTELIHRLRSRDRSAWEQLYGEYQPRLRAFAFRLTGNVHDADDLVQETFVRAVPRLDKLDPESVELGAYLFGTCKNLFYKQTERAKRAEPVAEVPEPPVPAHIEDDPERAALLRSQQRDVRLANSRLDSRQRLVLALRELEDRSYAEIGEIVGLKENAVAQLVFRARESLRVEVRLVQVDPDSFPPACRRYLPLLARHLDGELTGPRLDETLVHLEGCERCQGALADMREASRRYRMLFLPPFLDGDECKAAIDLRLDESGYWTQVAPRRLGGWRGVAALGAGALILAVGGTATGVVLADSERSASPAAASPASTSVPASPPPPSAVTAEPIPGRSPAPTPVVAPEKGETATGPESTATSTGPVPAKPAAVETNPVKTTTEPAPEPKPEQEATDPTPKPPGVATPPAPPAPPPPSAPADTTPPTITVTSAPSGTVATGDVQIAFSADDAAASFNCSTDGSQAAACTSPVTLSGLAPGAHQFSVLATDEAGNSSAWKVVSWTYVPPDRTAPNVRITSAPPRSTTDPNARFEFAADESPVTFECALDKGAFTKCSPPASYTKLAPGAHTFTVRASDRAGNVGQASASWTIVRPLPDLVITAFTPSSIQITNQGAASAPANVLSITLVGTFTVPPLAPGASVRLTWSTCRNGTYTAVVDRGQTVAESDEANNTASRNNTCSIIG